MSTSGDFGNPLRKFKLVFLGEQSGNESDVKLIKKDLHPTQFHLGHSLPAHTNFRDKILFEFVFEKGIRRLQLPQKFAFSSKIALYSRYKYLMYIIDLCLCLWLATQNRFSVFISRHIRSYVLRSMCKREWVAILWTWTKVNHLSISVEVSLRRFL